MNRHQQEAVRIADRVMELICFAPGDTEKKVAGRIEAFLKGFDAKPAFRTIVASGPRSAKPHGYATNRKIRKNEIVMIDFGALYKGWRSDITRTFFAGKPNAKQRKMYAIVKAAQEKAIRVVRAGVECRVVDRIAREYMKVHGLDRHFIHSTGHGVGRKIHENPRINTRNHNKLKAGQVITVEPGVYLKGWGGIRIEDMVLVTKDGGKMLTRSPR
ncbi:MAG TPA: M24 family metallopeptidase [Candidatus Omnitrophota bacterium]|nr:M24 family metallopeptidase [Candidatus Omnitrophota bacterium]